MLLHRHHHVLLRRRPQEDRSNRSIDTKQQGDQAKAIVQMEDDPIDEFLWKMKSERGNKMRSENGNSKLIFSKSIKMVWKMNTSLKKFVSLKTSLKTDLVRININFCLKPF